MWCEMSYKLWYKMGWSTSAAPTRDGSAPDLLLSLAPNVRHSVLTSTTLCTIRHQKPSWANTHWPVTYNQSTLGTNKIPSSVVFDHCRLRVIGTAVQWVTRLHNVANHLSLPTEAMATRTVCLSQGNGLGRSHKSSLSSSTRLLPNSLHTI